MIQTVVTNNSMSADALNSLHLSKLAKTFGLFANSVAMRPINVEVKLDATPNPPAYSSSQALTVVHDNNLGPVAKGKNIIRLKGLVIHELAHILYTPRTQSGVLSKVNNYFMAFNILEDNRIENLMVARMSGVKPWLTHAITEELLTNMEVTNYPLIVGRKYLDPAIAATARRLYANQYGEEQTRAVELIVNEYITLNYHDKDDSNLAIKLVRDLDQILNYQQASYPKTHNHKDESSSPNSEGGQKPLGKRDTDKDLDKVKQMSAEHQRGVDDEQNNSTAGNGNGCDTSSPEEDFDNLREQLQQQSAESYEDVMSDVKDTLEAVKGSSSGVGSGPKDSRVAKKVPHHRREKEIEVTSDYFRMYSAFAKELQQVKAMTDPFWDRKTSEGRLNVRSLMLDGDLDTAFDKWDDSLSEASDIECVVLLDTSGSMFDLMDDAKRSVWSIKKAFDSIEASTTVIEFATRTSYMYKAQERAGSKVRGEDRWASGGTNPLFALREAQTILNNSPRAIKVLLIVTDGQWENTKDCESLIMSMRQSNVLTGLMFLMDDSAQEHLGRLSEELQRDYEDPDDLAWRRKVYGLTEDGSYRIDGHKCEVVHDGTDVQSMPQFARKLAKLAQHKLLEV